MDATARCVKCGLEFPIPENVIQEVMQGDPENDIEPIPDRELAVCAIQDDYACPVCEP